ncbi:ATP-binding cassette sub-family G member 5-like [Limulus polyphemus]|uniref:ATP-binding cassette sub-family G member 5-like n=1 Tax=Limulus polyphemus TaxID=6850 RepID=A0ABM1TEP5_LIMPO|nr:ATP-binding cassette sub-family G member 5-like [Limulus polyphemus]
MDGDHVLELISVFHMGQVAGGSYIQKILGSAPMGIILKDVTFEVHAGEVMAILGSKGSGKKTLLEVIARRAMGLTRGQILLNDVPMSIRLFQEQCGYVPKKLPFIPGLTVLQTLTYAGELSIGSKVSNSMKRSRVKQVMTDLALNQVSNREVSTLATSDYRRLAIGTELVKDPVLVLLDEPTYEVDPLNSYFVISSLSNHAKKYKRIVIINMDQPRSDIFPFLDRVTYLCLGDVVYTGSTRMMMEYFRSVGFPCPDRENPLTYYLCLSTVDRRTRERFIESSSQIADLVERFKTVGTKYRKLSTQKSGILKNGDNQWKLPLTAYGQPSGWRVFTALTRRSFASLFNVNNSAFERLTLHVVALPVFFTILYLLYFPLENTQQSYISRNGLLFNCLVGMSLLGAAVTARTYGAHRTRYYNESRQGMYRGPLFILSRIVCSVPLNLMTVWAGATIIYSGTRLRQDWDRWAAFCGVLWAVFTFAEQQTIALMIFIRSSYTAFLTSTCILLVYIILASGTVRTMAALPDWLYYLSYGVIYRYAGAFLNENEFDQNPSLVNAPSINMTSGASLPCFNNNVPGECYWLNGTHYLSIKYHFQRESFEQSLQYWLNFGMCYVFVGGMWLVNIIIYLLPLPAFIKVKFRD